MRACRPCRAWLVLLLIVSCAWQTRELAIGADTLLYWLEHPNECPVPAEHVAEVLTRCSHDSTLPPQWQLDPPCRYIDRELVPDWQGPHMANAEREIALIVPDNGPQLRFYMGRVALAPNFYPALRCAVEEARPWEEEPNQRLSFSALATRCSTTSASITFTDAYISSLEHGHRGRKHAGPPRCECAQVVTMGCGGGGPPGCDRQPAAAGRARRGGRPARAFM